MNNHRVFKNPFGPECIDLAAVISIELLDNAGNGKMRVCFRCEGPTTVEWTYPATATDAIVAAKAACAALDRYRMGVASGRPEESPKREARIEIVEITVGAGTGFNHPYEQFSNFKPSVTLRAKIDGGPDVPVEEAVRQLQLAADRLVNAEKERILAALEREEGIDRARDAVSLSRYRVANAKADLQNTRKLVDEAPAILAADDAKTEGERMDSWRRQATEHRIAEGPKLIEVAEQALAECESQLRQALTDLHEIDPDFQVVDAPQPKPDANIPF
jgi:hypothetical protein